jgi:hypothetical protein
VDAMNYVVGRGRLFFGQFKAGTVLARPQLYFGNTPELSLSQSEDTLDHYSSEGGIRVKDASVTLQNDSSGSFSCDNISPENLALWFLGEVISRMEAGSAAASGTVTFSTAAPVEGDSVTINGTELTFSAAAGPNTISPLPATIGDAATALAAEINSLSAVLGVTAEAAGPVTTISSALPGTGGNAITLTTDATTPANLTASGATLAGGVDVTEEFAEVELGRWLQLGKTAVTPQGVRNVGSVAIAGVDAASFTVENETGRVLLHEDADDIVAGSTIEISYGVLPQTETVVIAKGQSVEGELQFIANNPVGANDDYFWPRVRLTPDGDFSLKGDDWQTVSWNFEILKKDSVTERQYITRRKAS